MKRSYSSLSSSSNSSSSPSQSSINSNATTNGGSRVGPTRAPPPLQQRQQPVIIYTHSPRVIHTHPRDFMALVQKLTGLYRPEEDHEALGPAQPKSEEPNNHGVKKRTQIGANNSYNNDETESSSVITEEENNKCGGNNNNIGDQYGQMITSEFVQPNSCESPSTYITGLSSIFNPNATDFLYWDHSNFYGHYGDRLLLAPKNDEPQFHQPPLWRS